MQWLSDNASWIFSGVGVIFLTGIGYVIKIMIAQRAQGQRQKVTSNSTAIQAGRDAYVGNAPDSKKKKTK